MPKDAWKNNGIKHRRKPKDRKTKPQSSAAWARFETLLAGGSIPIATPEELARDEERGREKRRKKWLAKSKKKQPVKRKKRQERKNHNYTAWTGCYRDYLTSKQWADKRKEAFKYHGRTCHDCGSDRRLEVHHLSYKRLGREKMKDLQVLCGDCHRLRHEDKPGVLATDYLSVQFRAIIG